MSAPTITSRTPTPNETNVYLNQLIYVIFDQAIDSTTLTDNTILLYRVSDYEVLDKTIEYTSSTYTLTITPDVIFNQNTAYNIVIVGLDQSTTCVKNASGESLATTSTWYFTTGTSTYTIPEDTQPETQPEEAVADSPVSKVLEPKSVTSFAITSTSPDNYNTNLGTINDDYATVTWAGPITITFNNPVASGVLVSQSWVSVAAAAVDGDPSTSIYAPSGVLSNTNGNTLTWTPAETAAWKVNNEITVTVDDAVQDYSGELLGADYQFMFTTRYYPYYCSVSNIRTVIGPFIRDINDDAIGRNIYLNSTEIYNIANTVYSQEEWAMGSPTFAAKQWTCCKTQYDILYAKLLDMGASGAGQLKRLGDFTVQEATAIQDGIKGALQKALDCMNAWFVQVLGKYRKAKAKLVVKGVASTVTPPMRGVRTWSVPTQAEGVGANKRKERQSKSPGIYDEWS